MGLAQAFWMSDECRIRRLGSDECDQRGAGPELKRQGWLRWRRIGVANGSRRWCARILQLGRATAALAQSTLATLRARLYT